MSSHNNQGGTITLDLLTCLQHDLTLIGAWVKMTQGESVDNNNGDYIRE